MKRGDIFYTPERAGLGKSKRITAAQRDAIIEIVYTNYSGGLPEKERRLQNAFDYYRLPIAYSQQAVIDIFYDAYKAKGGYRSKEEHTAWIFKQEA